MWYLILRLFNFLFIKCGLPILGARFSIGRGSKLSKCDAHHVRGYNNRVIVADDSKLNNCEFVFKGNDNTVIIGSRCSISRSSFWISGNGNKIEIGDGTTVGNDCQFAALEGTTLKVGNDCMFSHNIRLRTSDSHSIVDSKGNRINYSKNIVVGNHVWVGLESLILKGSVIADNSVVAARATVNKQFEQSGCIIAGAPAKQIKEDINWDRRKL